MVSVLLSSMQYSMIVNGSSIGDAAFAVLSPGARASPLQLLLLGRTGFNLASFSLSADNALFHSEAALTVHGSKGSRIVPPPLGVYRSEVGECGWLRAIIQPATHTCQAQLKELVVFAPWEGEVFTIVDVGGDKCAERQPVSTGRLTDEGHDRATRALAQSLRLPLSPEEKALWRRNAHSRRAQLVQSAPPYSRLVGCPATGQVYDLTMGLVLDYGFVRARGGVDAALLAVAASVSKANAIFTEQLGVQLRIMEVIVNEVAGGDWRLTGPNEVALLPSCARHFREC